MNRLVYNTNSALKVLMMLMLLSAFVPFTAKAQSGQCDPTVPFYIVDLSSDPNMGYITPYDKRKGICCGAVSPDRCIEFEVTLHPNALGIAFDLYSGAVPSGSMFYQINCGPLIPVGQAVCLAGVGPHTVTFCKPGNNPNEYFIKSIPAPTTAPDAGVRIGCSIELRAGNLIPSTISWTDITSGTGQYDSLLSCVSGCDTTYFSPVPGTPGSIDYEVCGMVFDSLCGGNFYVCDTVNVSVFPELIVPDLDTIVYCSTAGGVTLDGQALGGFGNYTYMWTDTNGNPLSANSTIFVTEGYYRLEIRDELYPACPAELQDIRVLADDPAIVNAGNDTTICDATPVVSLYGSVTDAPGGYWTVGAGFLNSPDSILTNTYYPTLTEVNSGSITLTLTSRPDTACPVVTDNLIVSFMDPPLIDLQDIQNVTCNGAADGYADLDVINGNPPYTYSWDHGPTSQDVSGLDTGSYQMIVTDNLGCTDTLAVAITQPDVLDIDLDIANVSCNSGSDGTAQATVSGGTPGYTYQWSNGQTTAAISNLIAGNYFLTVLDANGCQALADTTITEPTVMTLTLTDQDITCNGFSNGSLQANPGGGIPPYTYLWSTGATSQNISGLAPGTYGVTVADSNGCIIIGTSYITQPAALVTSSIVNHVSCFGGSNGSVSTIVSGGTPPYTYNWSNGSTSSSANNLTVGTYTVTITDNNGCTITSGGTVTQPTQLNLNINLNNVTCNGGSDGSATSVVSGGAPPYSYFWSSGETSPGISGMPIGDYILTVIDNNSCVIDDTVTIAEPGQLALTFNPVDAACNGGSDGSVNMSVAGGIPPYTYSWSNGATTEDLSGVIANVYWVTVTDASGCTTTDFSIVNEPSAIVPTVDVVNHVSCFGGSNGALNLTVTGGINPYAYNWSNGETTEDVIGLSAGYYFVTVNDINNCVQITYGLITEPDSLVTTITPTHITCRDDNDGMLDLEVSGGVAPYGYNWSTASGSQDVNSLAEGTYTVTVMDANGCIKVDQGTIINPDSFIVAETLSHVSCKDGGDGSITLNVTGGWLPYTYQWSTGATTKDIVGLGDGNYTVTVTDDHGCVRIITYTITEPDYLQLTYSVSNVSCFGGSDGSITVAPTGGTPPYSYAWSNGPTTAANTGLAIGSYQVTLTDANGCNITAQFGITEPTPLSGSVTYSNISCFGAGDGAIDIQVTGGTTPYSYAWTNGATSQDLINLGPGVYQVTVTDANGCDILLTGTIAEPAQLAISVNKTDVDCNGNNNGTASVLVAGGTLPYSYLWSNNQTTSSIFNLVPGNYWVTVTDANGCSVTGLETVTQPTALATVITKSNVSCNGGSDGYVDLFVSGGTPGYNYSWSNGATSEDISGLPTGTYTVTISDQNGCGLNRTINITQPAPLVVNGNHKNVTCYGNANGSVDITVNGGTLLYTYNWSNGATTQDIYNLGPGTYTVTVTDAKGCSATLSRQVTEPSLLTMSLTSIDITCFGDNDGVINATYTGGLPRHRFTWSHGPTSALVGNLAPGTYTVTLTDGNGCQVTDQATINEPGLLQVSGVSTDVTCYDFNNATIDVTATGGIPGYGYMWSSFTQLEDLTGIGPGNYSLTITDQNGCNAYFDTVITEPTELLLTATLMDASCNGGADGAVDVTVTGGISSYNYNWSNGNFSQDLVNVTAGGYQLTVTDQNSCTIDTFFAINEPALLQLTVNLIQDVSCFGGNDGALDVTVTGGVNPNQYQWSNGDTTQAVNQLTAGNYFVTVIDQNGCMAVAGGTIAEPQPLVMGGYTVDVTCNGLDDGEIDAVITGGTRPYSYNWTVAGTDSFLRDLVAGTYGLTVTDTNGCFDTISFTITEPIVLVSSAAIGQHVSCNGGNNGQATASGTGGTPPYTYNWSNGASGATVTGLTAGYYEVTVSDQFGCGSVSNVTITEPQPLNVILIKNDVSCFGGTNGGISPMVSGGTYPYSYLWSNASTDSTQTNLAIGTYTVTVTDANGCIFTNTTSVYEPIALTNTINNTPASCYGGSDGTVDLEVTGGVAPYTYDWSNNETTQDITGLTEDTYTVFITDANGCMNVAVTTVTQPDSLTVTATVQDVACAGGSDGAISLGVTGGVGAYSYMWTGGYNGANYNNIAIGTYNFTVTDANGCSSTGTETVTEPTPLFLSLTGTPVICNGSYVGQVSTNVVGGASPYTYAWSNSATSPNISGLSGGIYEVTVTDANGCQINSAFMINELTNTAIINPNVACAGDSVFVSGSANPDSVVQQWDWNFGDGYSQSGQNASHVYNTAGLYSIELIATLQSGCFDTTDAQVLIFGAPNADAGADQNICFGQQAVLTGTGGTSYQWTPAWYVSSPQSSTTTALPTQDTEYILTVTDANGCSAMDTVNVIVLSAPQPDLGPDAGICLGQSIQLNAQGGVLYNWVDGDYMSCTNCPDPTVQPYVSNPYIVQVTDGNGCTAYDTIRVNVNPLPPGLSLSSVEACEYETVQLSGAAGPYTYDWSPKGVINDPYAQVAVIDSVTTNMVFTLTTTNQFGCQYTDSLQLIVNPLPNPTFPDNAVICNGDTAFVIPSQGYFHVWDPLTDIYCQFCPEVGLHPDVSTQYTISVLSDKNCLRVDTVDVLVDQLPFVDVGNGVILCQGDEVQMDAQAGGEVISYNWVPGNGLDTTTVLQPIAGPQQTTTYTLTVVDTNGCINSDDATITVRQEIGILEAEAEEICEGDDITLYVNEDTTVVTGVQYTWFDTIGGQPIGYGNSLTFNPYEDMNVVLIANTQGACQPDTIDYLITVNPTPELDAGDDIRALAGEEVILMATDDPDYFYVWSPDPDTCGNCNSIAVADSFTTTYTVSVTDENGCTNTDRVTIYVFETCTDDIFIPNSFTPNNDGLNDEFRPRSNINYGIQVFRVFDRWGNLVYETENLDQGWDGYHNGSQASPDVYVYYVRVLCDNGTESIIKGNVTLIR